MPNRNPSPREKRDKLDKLAARCQASSSPSRLMAGTLRQQPKAMEQWSDTGSSLAHPFLANQVFNRPTPFQRLPTFGTHALPLSVRMVFGAPVAMRVFPAALLREILPLLWLFPLCHSENSMPRRMLPTAVRAVTCQEPHSIKHCWKSIQAPLPSRRSPLDSRLSSNEAHQFHHVGIGPTRRPAQRPPGLSGVCGSEK